MNASVSDADVARERHRTLDFVDLRAHATAVGLIQLCEELLKADVLSAEALDRIKDAICSELALESRARVSDRQEFNDSLRRRIDAVFPSAPGEPPRDQIGSLEDFGDALSGYHGASR